MHNVQGPITKTHPVDPRHLQTPGPGEHTTHNRHLQRQITASNRSTNIASSPQAYVKTYVLCICEDIHHVDLPNKQAHITHVVRSHGTPHTKLTCTIRAQVHVQPKHLELSRCCYKTREREARRGWERRKGVERQNRGQGSKRERSSLGEEAGDQVSWSGLLSVIRRYPWGGHTDLVVTAGTVVLPGK